MLNISSRKSSFKRQAPTVSAAVNSTPTLTPMTPLSEHAKEPLADAGILEFGTLVSVNNERSKAILQQVKEISANCTALREQTLLEQKVDAELRKSRAHSKSEATTLYESMKETNETLNMNIHILEGIETTFVGMRRSITTDDSCSFADGSRGCGDATVLKGKTTVMDTIEAVTKQLQEIPGTWSHEINIMKDVLDRRVKDLGNALQLCSELEEAEAAAKDRIQGEGLKDDLAKLKIEVAKLESELGTEEERHRNVILNHENRKASLLQFEMQGKQMQNVLETMKNANDLEESELERYAKAQAEDVQRARHMLAEQEAEYTKLTAQTEELLSSLIEAEKLIEEREGLEAEREHGQQDRTKLLNEQNSIGAQLLEVTEENEELEREIGKVQIELIQLEAKKLENDKTEFEEIIPRRAEHSDMKSDREKLLTHKKEREDEIQKVIEQHKAATIEETKQSEKLRIELELRKRTNEEHEAQLKDLELEVSEQQKSYKSKIVPMEDEYQRLEDMRKKEQQEVDLMEEEHDKGQSLAAELQRKVDVLRKGASLLKETAKVEQRLSNLDLVLEEVDHE